MTDQEIKTLLETNARLTEQVALLTEQVAYLTRKLYGKSSEKGLGADGQLDLFDENSSDEDDDLPSRRSKRDYYL